MSNVVDDVLYIATPEALAGLCERLRGVPWLALDTEFIREKTYYPQLCLIQLATPDVVACIDPLTLSDLGPLLDLLHEPSILKVLHAASQDLEILCRLRDGIPPAPVFDTQIAATLLGHGEQVGYATLVQAMLGIELDKSQTRTDWSQRPLAPEQIRYAADDVRHLCRVYESQRQALEQQDRLAWLEPDFQALADPARYRTEPLEAWRRVKGCQQLRGVQLNVLRTLAAWREEQAVASNRPRRWILGDDVLFDLARLMPRDLERLARIRSLDGSTLRRHGDALLALIQAARQAPESSWPRLPARQHLSSAQEALVDVLQALLRLRGAEHGVSPQLLAGRKELESLVLGDAEVPLLQGWRARLAGQEVQALLRGERCLRIENGALRILPVAD
ncbi:MAG TPA: ribonuclease D [Candidatus Competibacteraceae bacterium]|nr:ribonuclease D [Candidatus Competibacteraceae bacterium]